MSESGQGGEPTAGAANVGDESASGVSLERLLGSIEAGIAPAPSSAPGSVSRGVASRTAGRSVIFGLGATRCSLPIDRVVEIGEVPKMTPVPNVPPWVRGVANLRGDVLAVIDLRALVGLQPFDALRPLDREGRMLVVRSSPGLSGEVAAGLIVDAVFGVARTDDARLAPPGGPIDDALAAWLRGVQVHEGRLLAAIDLDILFATPELKRLRAESAPGAAS